MGVLQRRRAGRAYLYSLNEANYLVSDSLLPAFRSEAEWLQRLGKEVFATLNRRADSIVLYGSWARAQAASTSDVDLLVVTRSVRDRKEVERTLETQRGRLAERFGRPVSLLVISRDEFRRRLRRGDRLIREIVREGRAVAGRSIAEVIGGGLPQVAPGGESPVPVTKIRSQGHYQGKTISSDPARLELDVDVDGSCAPAFSIASGSRQGAQSPLFPEEHPPLPKTISRS